MVGLELQVGLVERKQEARNTVRSVGDTNRTAVGGSDLGDDCQIPAGLVLTRCRAFLRSARRSARDAQFILLQIVARFRFGDGMFPIPLATGDMCTTKPAIFDLRDKSLAPDKAKAHVAWDRRRVVPCRGVRSTLFVSGKVAVSPEYDIPAM